MMKQLRTIELDADTRAQRMLHAGRVDVTVTSKVTGRHITIQFKAKRQAAPGSARRWESVGYDDATHLFISAGQHDRVGTYYPRSGKFYEADHADPARVWAALNALAWIADGGEHDQAEFVEESHCGRCGRELTDPVSIERGIGPECYGKLTGSQHQVKASRLGQQTI